MYSRRSSRQQPMGSGGDATPCKSHKGGPETFLFKVQGVIATQLSRMFHHPHSSQGCTAIHTRLIATQIARMFRHPHETQELHWHRPHERQGADPRTAPFEGTPNAEALFNLDVGDELLEIVRRAGRLRAFADWNDEMSERGWVRWMVFGGSFYLIPQPTLSSSSLLPCGFGLIRSPHIWS